MLGDQRSEVYVAGSRSRLPGELLPNLGAYPIAPTADGRPKMNRQLIRRKSVTCESSERFCRDLRRSSPPAGMKESNDSGWMRNKNGYAIRNANCEGDSLLCRDMTVGFLGRAKPAFPAAGVDQDARAVHLPDRCEPACCLPDFALERSPPRHDLHHRLRARQAECAGIPRRGEGANSPAFEVGNCFLGYLVHLSGADRQLE